MNRNTRTKCLAVLFVAALGSAPTNARSQDKPANNLEIVHEKLKADKKLIVSKYMELTESEAKSFWPVYEDYQKDLQTIHERLGALLKAMPRTIAASRSLTRKPRSCSTSGSPSNRTRLSSAAPLSPR